MSHGLQQEADTEPRTNGAEHADASVADDDTETDRFTFDDLSVVMGTYNEEAAIGTVLDDIEAVTDGKAEVVCVDGSADRTPEIAREHGARVIEQEPQGYGVAQRGVAGRRPAGRRHHRLRRHVSDGAVAGVPRRDQRWRGCCQR